MISFMMKLEVYNVYDLEGRQEAIAHPNSQRMLSESDYFNFCLKCHGVHYHHHSLKQI